MTIPDDEDEEALPPRKKSRRVVSDSEGSDADAIENGANDSVDEDDFDSDANVENGRSLPPIMATEDDVTDMSDAEDDRPRPTAFRHVKAKNGDARAGSDSDEVSVRPSARRKRRAESTESRKAAEMYDLQELADNGHGGRVLFVFEKIAKARFE